MRPIVCPLYDGTLSCVFPGHLFSLLIDCSLWWLMSLFTASLEGALSGSCPCLSAIYASVNQS
jgi:hypothetical protein